MSSSCIAQRSVSDQWATRSAIGERSQSIPIPSDAYQGEAKSEKTYLPGAGVFVRDDAELGKRTCL